MFSDADRALLVAAAVIAGLAVLCALALLVDAAPILGVHPAVKPLKFAVAVSLMLASLAVLLPRLAVSPRVSRGLGLVLLGCLVLELVPILFQALRGRASHFNRTTPLDAGLWYTMGATIAVLTITMLAVALLATLRPLRGLDALVAMAWRAGVWLFMLAAISGAGMGGRNTHTVGGAGGGGAVGGAGGGADAGMPLTGWSRGHGDLRVSHFFALHAFQLIPLLGYGLAALPIGPPVRWAILLAAVAAQAALVIGTLAQALAGRPLW